LIETSSAGSGRNPATYRAEKPETRNLENGEEQIRTKQQESKNETEHLEDAAVSHRTRRISVRGFGGDGLGARTISATETGRCSLHHHRPRHARGQALDVNNNSLVSGVATLTDGTEHAFLWQKGVITDIGTPGQQSHESDSLRKRS
jgi:probable HAF family extracellular repeat protein